jgi:uncharacterized protein YfaT (DUF1175 family)
VRFAVVAAGVLLGACGSKQDLTQGDRNPLQAETVDLADRFGDGTPEFLRLETEGDRRAFRKWFTLLAESQYYRPPGKLPREINDCAALLRFAYRQAVREHDGAWATELDLDAPPSGASVQKFIYPRTPLGAGLFRIRPGPFVAADLNDGAFAQFADADTLRRYNTHKVTRDIRLAQPGDLLFYKQLEQNMPFHAMLYLGRSHFEESTENWIIYHTGPLYGGKGEIRRPAVSELLRHPSPRWRPNTGNGNFLGIYRWNILREPE